MLLQACPSLLVDFHYPNVPELTLGHFSATVSGEGIDVARVNAKTVAFAVPAASHDRVEGTGVRRYQERRPGGMTPQRLDGGADRPGRSLGVELVSSLGKLDYGIQPCQFCHGIGRLPGPVQVARVRRVEAARGGHAERGKVLAQQAGAEQAEVGQIFGALGHAAHLVEVPSAGGRFLLHVSKIDRRDLDFVPGPFGVVGGRRVPHDSLGRSLLGMTDEIYGGFLGES
mmetsp:Transcript_724/g.1746  ORF Transcript_724/g.1746 Transcript_724/m.1746 type:complete len:228 (-) Transcript_724:267-950(-)